MGREERGMGVEVLVRSLRRHVWPRVTLLRALTQINNPEAFVQVQRGVAFSSNIQRHARVFRGIDEVQRPAVPARYLAERRCGS